MRNTLSMKRRKTVSMKIVYKFATLTLMVFAVSVCGFSQKAATQRPKAQTPEVTTQNLVRGLVGPVGTDSNWANYSLFAITPGSALFPISSATTVFYFGFTGGTEADIGNMVVYTVSRGSLTITAVTPVTYGGVSNPSIVLSNASVCPVAPSQATPCIVRFDPTSLTMSPTSDYYLTVFFTNDSNNQSLAAAEANNFYQSGVYSTWVGGTDYTHLTVGQSIPAGGAQRANFLMYVMNN